MKRLASLAVPLAVSLALAGCSSPAYNPLAPGLEEAPQAASTGGYPSSGPALVAFVAARYPERLAAGVSYDDRVANVEFLRDRIIEAGICGGMNLAWNLKRGVGPRSVDAIDWRHGVEDINDVVDIAFDWDNTDRPLELQWQVTDGPAGWDPFPQPACR